MFPVTPAATAEAVVQSGDATVKSAAMKSAAVKLPAVEATESTAMKSTTAVESPAASVRCVGEMWLAEGGRAQ